MFRYGLVLLGLALVPSTALAVEVECSNEDGSCTVSNDGGTDSVECDCDGVSSGTTGGNEWAGLDEDEMDEVCLGELELCGGFGSTGFGTSDTGVFTDPVPSTTVIPGTDTGDSSTTDGPVTTGTDSGTTTGDPDTTTGDPDTTTGDPDTTTGDPDTTTGDPIDPTESATNNNGESGNGEEGGESETTDDESGCGCTTAGPEGGFAMALGLFGLMALRRRR